MTDDDEKGQISAEEDFFGDIHDDEAFEKARQKRELESIRRPHYTAGVREGVSTAHESNVQGGFDDGFADGAKAAAKSAFLYVCQYIVAHWQS